MRLPPTLTCQKCNRKMICIDGNLTMDNFDFNQDIPDIVAYPQMQCPECKYTCDLFIDGDHINTIIQEYYKDGGKEECRQ